MTQSADKPIITIEKMNKWYGDFHVLQDIDLAVQPGERIVICGPSGSGKSTLIRCINRLEEHQSGKIVVDGIELTDDMKNIEQVRTEVGMVFQHFNLFPHLSIIDNLTLGPIHTRKISRKEAEETAIHYLQKVMTMLVVSHEMGFARKVAHRVLFMDAGEIVEASDPHNFFENPQHKRTRKFLAQILL